MRRFRLRRSSRSASLQRLKMIMSALDTFSITSCPMFFRYGSKVCASIRQMIWYRIQFPGRPSRYRGSIIHMPLYSMMTCLGLYCFSSFLKSSGVSSSCSSTV